MTKFCSILAMIYACSVAIGQDAPKFKSEKARVAWRTYAREVAKSDAELKAAMAETERKISDKRAKLKEELINQLQVALIEAAKRVELDEALAIRTAIRELEKKEVAGGPNRNRRIPDGAVQFKGHKYLVFFKPTTWHLAREQCEELGGHLIRIESAQEQQFIERLLKTLKPPTEWVWIGGSDADDEGKWRFGNGKPIKFAKWVKGEPNNIRGVEHSAQIYVVNGLWYDGIGTARHEYICEWD